MLLLMIHTHTLILYATTNTTYRYYSLPDMVTQTSDDMKVNVLTRILVI